MEIKWAFTWVAVVTGFVLCSGKSPIAADESDIVRRVVNDWTARRKKFEVVRYMVEGKITVPQGALNGFGSFGQGGFGSEPSSDPQPASNSPPEDTTYKSSRTYLINFPEGLIRREHDELIWEIDLRVFNRTKQVTVFDGSSVKIYRPSEENLRTHYNIAENTPEFVFLDGQHMQYALRDPHDLPVYVAHGLLMFARTVVDEFKVPIDPQAITLHRKIGDDEVLLRIGATQQFWELRVDLSRQSAIVAAAFQMRGTILQDVSVKYQERDESWLPIRWRSNVFDQQGKVTATGVFEVEQLDTGLGGETRTEFDLIPPTGKVVQTDEGHFRVASDGEWMHFDPRARQQGGISWMIIGLATVGGVVFVAGLILVWKRFKSARSL